MKFRTLVVLVWAGALSAWVIYERALRNDLPPPEPPPPPRSEAIVTSAATCPHADLAGMTGTADSLIAAGQDWVRIIGYFPDVEGFAGVYVFVIGPPGGDDHTLTFASDGHRCDRCGAESVKRLAAVPYHRILYPDDAPAADINRDGITEILIPHRKKDDPFDETRWHVFQIHEGAVHNLTPPMENFFPRRPQDIDGDGVCELVFSPEADRPGYDRYLVWDPEARRYSETLADPLYEQLMAELQDVFLQGPTDGDVFAPFLFYATLRGMAENAWEIARPWILAAGIDLEAFRERLDAAVKDLTIPR